MEVYFENLTAEDASLEKLAEDVSLLMQNAERLVQASGDNLSKASKAELENGLARMKIRAERIKHGALAGARATDRIIRQYPYPSLGMVFALGFLLAVLLIKRK